MGMASTDILFLKKLPLIIKSPDRDKRKVHIEVCLEVHSIVNPLPKKEMVIRLTDEQDLFFLYTLHLGEEDFQSLKIQQGLLVDFTEFPQSVIGLLQSVLAEEHKEMPKFILELECNGGGGLGSSSATLNFVETNSFKHLTHLAVRFLPGSDSDVKKYLADCLKKLKDQNHMLYSKLQHTESDLSQQLTHAQEALSARTAELDSLKADWATKVNQLTSQHAKELNDEKEKSIQAQASMQNKHERERRELDQAHSALTKQKDAKIYDLEAANRDLLDVRYKSDATIKELKSRLGLAEEDLGRAKTELSNLRKNNANLDGDFHEQSKALSALETKVALLQQDARNKDDFIRQTSELLETEKLHKRKIEEEVEKKHKHVKKQEFGLKKVSEELTKANQIIQRLQNETKSYHEKLKVRNRVTTEQEKLLKEQSDKLDEVRKTLDETQAQLRRKEDENQKLAENLSTVSEKLDESKELLKNNENVIGWLNKKLTDVQLGSLGPTGGQHEMNSTASSFQHSSRPPLNYSGQSYGSGRFPAAAGGAFSAAAGGAQPPGAVPTASGLVSAAPPPPFYHSKPQPQVSYNPNLAGAASRKSGVPVPIAKSSPIVGVGGGVIPEERALLSEAAQRRTSSPTLAAGGVGAAPTRAPPPLHSQPPEAALDPKYFQKSSSADETPPVARGGGRAASPTPLHFTSPPTIPHTRAQTHAHQTRLSKDVIVPSVPPATKPLRPKAPLSSAYFPANQGKVS